MMSPRNHGFDNLTLLDDNPLVQDCLARMRKARTSCAEFNEAAALLSFPLAVEAARYIPTIETNVATPLDDSPVRMLEGGVVLVPILRAGLGIMPGFERLFRGAAVGHVGLSRNEETLEPEPYLLQIPPLADRTVMILDPMLATGGSVAFTLKKLMKAGLDDAAAVVMACVLAVPEGVRKVSEVWPHLPIISAALDPVLNDVGYIVPGLGDAGDRLFGTIKPGS